MVRWRSDTCNSCVWLIEQEGAEWVGTAEQVCPHHATFSEALTANQFKNKTINTINDTLGLNPESEKSVSFSQDGSGGVIFHFNNFDQNDIDTINGLNLNITVE